MTAVPTIRHKTWSWGEKGGVTDHKFLLLFVYLLASLIYYPYVQDGTFSYEVFRVGSSAGIFLAVYAVKLRRTLLICAILLAIPAALQRFLLFRADTGLFSLVGTLLSFAFDVFIVVLMFRRVFADQQVRSETIFGAICIYLLIGYGFAITTRHWTAFSRGRFISIRSRTCKSSITASILSITVSQR